MQLKRKNLTRFFFRFIFGLENNAPANCHQIEEVKEVQSTLQQLVHRTVIVFCFYLLSFCFNLSFLRFFFLLTLPNFNFRCVFMKKFS